MIKITKQLQRPDGGTVSANSIIDYNTKFVGEGKKVIFFLKHFVNQAAIDEAKPKILKVLEFSYVQERECTPEEWSELFTEAGAGVLVEGWLNEIMITKVGVGNTAII